MLGKYRSASILACETRDDFGHSKDGLWSVDLFRCESLILRTHWVLVVMDQFTRRIIGFATHRRRARMMATCQD
jgi:transposase InsO family protein